MTPVVLVTGASRGIGLAVARILLQRSTKVVSISRSNPAELVQLANDHPDDLLVVHGDITDPTVISSAVSQAKSRFGSLDALVLNAGTLDPLTRIASPDAADLDQWRSHFDTNFFSLVSALQAATPLLRESKAPGGAKVVFVSSGAAVGGTGGWGPYNAGKAAMNSLARTYATEEPNVVSVAFRPGVVDTDMQAGIRSKGSGSMSHADHAKFVGLHSGNRLASPDVPAGVIARLALEAGKELTGQFLNIDGPECAPFKA